MAGQALQVSLGKGLQRGHANSWGDPRPLLPDSENQRGQPTRAGDSGCVVCARKEAKDPTRHSQEGRGVCTGDYSSAKGEGHGVSWSQQSRALMLEAPAEPTRLVQCSILEHTLGT